MLHSEDGQILQVLGALVSIQATSEQTGGGFNLFDVSCPVGFSTPLHIHYTEEVAVFVLEGAITFFVGDQEMEATVGSYFFQPRGTPHGFRVRGNMPARILYMTIPAGFDTFVIELEGADLLECSRNAARYKIEVLGPLPK